MGALGQVEQLDRRGRVVQRTPLVSLPALVGRSPGCDVVVDDAFVCGNHLRLEADTDGGLVAVDLGSVNGTFAVDGAGRCQRVALAADTRLRIGRSVLRVRAAATPVAATERLARPARARRAGGGVLLPLVAVAAVGGLLALDGYLGTFRRMEAVELASQTLLFLFGLACYAGGWSLVNRIVAQEFRFPVHWAIACLMALGMTYANTAVDYAVFLRSPDEVPAALAFLGWSALGTLALFAQVSVFSSWRWPRRLAACALAAGSVMGVFELSSYAGEQHFSAQLDFPGRIEPYASAWLSPESLDTFYSDLDALRAEVDRLAEEDDEDDG